MSNLVTTWIPKPGEKFRIIAVHEQDAYYQDRHLLEGKTGISISMSQSNIILKGFLAGNCTILNTSLPAHVHQVHGLEICFFAIKVESLEAACQREASDDPQRWLNLEI